MRKRRCQKDTGDRVKEAGGYLTSRRAHLLRSTIFLPASLSFPAWPFHLLDAFVSVMAGDRRLRRGQTG